MRWILAAALVLALGTGGMRTASAQMPPAAICNNFLALRDDAQKKGEAIGAAQKRQVERKELCTLVTRFSAAEGAAVKFLVDNKAFCGVSDDAIKFAKASHEKTVKFQVAVCTEGPHPKAPTLSDALGAPATDTGKNTTTGRGTFDTLTGNPLAR